MTSDVKLLPLPDWGGAQIIPDNLIKDYARANVAHATEPLNVELLPCPFCGEGERLLVEHFGGTIHHPAHRIRCDNCGASIGYTDRDFRAKWNARASVEAAMLSLADALRDHDQEVGNWTREVRLTSDLIRAAKRRRLE